MNETRRDHDRLPVKTDLLAIIRAKKSETGKSIIRIVDDLLRQSMRQRGWMPAAAETETAQPTN